MKKAFRPLFALTIALSGALSAEAQATNDNFADATRLPEQIPLPKLTLTANNTDATGETGEPNHGGDSGPHASLWWVWTANSDGRVEIDTKDSGFNTALAVYTGSKVDQLEEAASNIYFTFEDQYSRVNFLAKAGVTYYIVVDGYEFNDSGWGEGNINLNVSFDPITGYIDTAFGELAVTSSDRYWSEGFGYLYGNHASGWLWSETLNDWLYSDGISVYAYAHGYVYPFGEGWIYSTRFGWLQLHSFDGSMPWDGDWYHSPIYDWMYQVGGYHYAGNLADFYGSSRGWLISSDSGTHWSFELGYITAYGSQIETNTTSSGPNPFPTYTVSSNVGILYSDKLGWIYIGRYKYYDYKSPNQSYIDTERFGWVEPADDMTATYFRSDDYGWMQAYGNGVVYSLRDGYFLP